MANSNPPRLCGGTFLSLILEARKQRTAPREMIKGSSDGLSDKEIFSGLIRVAFPTFEAPATDSFKTVTSRYKSCESSSSTYLPFQKGEFINNFNIELTTNYFAVSNRMHDFVTKYLDTDNYASWLASAFLELIELDDSINNDLFFIEDGNQPVEKNFLGSIEEVNLSTFLLGIWHFIILNRQDNTIGKNTIKAWFQQPNGKNSKKIFKSNIGRNKNINVDLTFEKIDLSNYQLVEPSISKISLNETGSFVENTDSSVQNPITVYLNNIFSKYNKMKTLIYSDEPKPFYDFYECNDIEQRIHIKKYTYRTKIISNATASDLQKCSDFILISGTGGLGKSMMMRHLLLESATNYSENKKLPIFVQLKDYNNGYENILSFIFEKFEQLGNGLKMDLLLEELNAGRCILLFDGLDEINSTDRKKFEQDLEYFTDKYKDNMFIISSRPTGIFVSFQRFTELKLRPFNITQALSLIDKLDFRPDEPNIKTSFRSELENTLYRTHREFTQNPLLLTIMLMTYEQFAEIPSKMHIFYREAYQALSQKHDASKGAYKRTLKTGISADRFSDYFAEFCARSYRDEKFEFTELEFEKYFKDLNEKKKDMAISSYQDFLDDLTGSMCLMYYESGRYHFTHRSFQEYFCALYFSKQKDKHLFNISKFFENKRSRNYGDITFNMLYDMISDKMDEYVFLPYLTHLLNKCDVENGYFTFLEALYPTIRYEVGTTGDYISNTPNSFLYDFLIRQKRLFENLYGSEFPYCEDFLTTNWVAINQDWESDEYDLSDVCDQEEVPYEYIEEFDDPEVVGSSFEFNIEDVLLNKDDYYEIFSVLNSDDFPLKEEYVNIRNYYSELKESQNPTGDDLFDQF